jgi:transposase
MKEQIQAVIGSTTRLAQIHARLQEIEEERVALEAEAKDILHRIGIGDAAGEWKDRRLPITRRVLSYLAARPSEQFPIPALARALGLSHRTQIQALRGALARLSDEGRVARTGPGVYSGKPGAV